MEHYYDEPTHVQSYKNKTSKPRKNFEKFYNKIWISVTAIHNGTHTGKAP